MPKTLDQLSTIRLDVLTDVDIPACLEWLAANCTTYVVYQEVAEVTGKVHLQGYVSLKDVKYSYKELKAMFHAAFEGSHAPQQRSFNQVQKVERYMRYVAKDKNLLVAQGVTEEHIAICEAQAYKKNKLTEMQRFVEQAREVMKEGEDFWIQKGKVCDIVIDAWKGKKRFNPFSIADVANSIMCELSDVYRNMLRDQARQRMI